MLITEMFPSIQGEGVYQGRHSLFIRFPNCNLSCKECDSKYSWKSGEIETTKIDDKLVFAECAKVNNIVFTGGEPLLKKNANAIERILKKFDLSKNYEIETNGTLELSRTLFSGVHYNRVQINISPKENFPQEKTHDTYLKLLEQIRTRYSTYILKYLFADEADLEFIKSEQKKHGIASEKIYVQPIGVSSKALIKTIKKHWKTIMDENWNVSVRSHVFLFENTKGV